MYYIVMYGSVVVALVSMLIMGVSMLIIPADKVKVEPRQDRDTAVRNIRRRGKCVSQYLCSYSVVGVGGCFDRS